jgi:hypothetical protein
MLFSGKTSQISFGKQHLLQQLCHPVTTILLPVKMFQCVFIEVIFQQMAGEKTKSND